jgi:hypothetical protein
VSTAQLPAALAPWAPALSVLTPELAIALGPMVRRLDALVARRAPAATTQGQHEGIDGLSRRGSADRILLSEWLLATEIPEEFLRRAANAELLHLAPAGPKPRPRGRVAVLLDTGPRQLGAGRLVQLAALVVLSRRALEAKAELVVGILGDPPGDWLTGELPELLDGWRTARRSVEPTNAESWLEKLGSPDEAWLFTGGPLAAELRGHRALVAVDDGEWGPAGLLTVRVRLAGAEAELPLPSPAVSINALRGAKFRRGSVSSVRADLRFPLFPSASRKMLARGSATDEIVTVNVNGGRIRRHQFGGQVLGASIFVRRLVALVAHGEVLSIEVVGKPLGSVDRIDVRLADLGLTVAAVRPDVEDTLRPIFYGNSGNILCQLAGSWYRLRPDVAADPSPVTAVSAGRRPDDPVLWFSKEKRETALVTADRVTGWTGGDGIWHLEGALPRPITVQVPAGEVLGIVRLDGTFWFVVMAPGTPLTLVDFDGNSRTLSTWREVPERPALHPHEPLIAVPRPGGRIEIADLARAEVLLTVGGGA